MSQVLVLPYSQATSTATFEHVSPNGTRREVTNINDKRVVLFWDQYGNLRDQKEIPEVRFADTRWMLIVGFKDIWWHFQRNSVETRCMLSGTLPYRTLRLPGVDTVEKLLSKSCNGILVDVCDRNNMQGNPYVNKLVQSIIDPKGTITTIPSGPIDTLPEELRVTPVLNNSIIERTILGEDEIWVTDRFVINNKPATVAKDTREDAVTDTVNT